MSETGTVLAVGAHPGAVETLCGGTLALLKRRGWKVVLASMTPGDKGGEGEGGAAADLADARRREAARGATVLGAEYHCLEWRELAVFLGDTASRKSTALVRAVRPDLVLTHSPFDSLGDHEQTARIMRHACFAAPVERYDVPGFPRFESPPPAERVPYLYYADPVSGIDDFGRAVSVDFIIDVGPVLDEKKRILEAHESLCAEPAELERLALQRGLAIGVEAGEGFRQHLGHGFPHEDVLSRALGMLVRPPGAGAGLPLGEEE